MGSDTMGCEFKVFAGRYEGYEGQVVEYQQNFATIGEAFEAAQAALHYPWVEIEHGEWIWAPFRK